MDHAPLLMNTVGDTDFRPRPLHFEAFWAKDRSKEVVTKAWNTHVGGSTAYSLCQHLKARSLLYEHGTAMSMVLSSP